MNLILKEVYKLMKLNACRMYLQVMTLTEISDYMGKELRPQVLLEHASHCPKGLTNISMSTLKWPHVALPSPTCWHIWTSMICTLYTGSLTRTHLQHPLGKWTIHYDSHRFWHWWHYDPTHLLFQQSAEMSPRVALRTQYHQTMAKFSPSIPTMLPFQGPPMMQIEPTTGYIHLPVACLPEAWVPTLHPNTIQLFHNPETIPCLPAAMTTGPLWVPAQSWLPKYPSWLPPQLPTTHVSQQCIHPKNGHSGFAWILAGNHTMIWCRTGLAPGPAEDMYLGHAEVYGLLATTIFLSYYVSCYDVPLPSTNIKCYCDNIGIINTPCSLQTEQILWLNDTINDDRDIFLEIHANVTNSTALCYQYFHVKGHQDKDPKCQLTLAKQYNIKCDQIAKQYIQTSPLYSTTMGNPKFKAAQSHLKIGGNIICHCFLLSLHTAASTPHIGHTCGNGLPGLKQTLTWSSGRPSCLPLTHSSVKTNAELSCLSMTNSCYALQNSILTQGPNYAPYVNATQKTRGTF